MFIIVKIVEMQQHIRIDRTAYEHWADVVVNF